MVTDRTWGNAAIVALCSVPVLIWIFMMPIGARFASTQQSLTSVGEILAVVGLTLFALAFVMNTRLRPIENLFGGLDREYRTHHLVGTFAFLFLLFHPLVIAASYLTVSAKEAASLFLSWTSWPVNFGILALSTMIIVLIITFYSNFKYHHWKLSHRFLGLAFAIACVHIYLIPSDISRNLILRGYVFIIAIVGLLAYSYRTLFWRFLVPKKIYTVTAVKDLGSNVTEITLSPKSKSLNHSAGQFLFISFSRPTSREQHPFTISSSPTEKNIRLSVKNLGDFTSSLPQLEKGKEAQIEGPYGMFTPLRYSHKPQIWVAGGIGITPFLSCARELAATHEPRLVHLFYSTKTAKEALFLDELRKVEKASEGFTVYAHDTEEDGRITAESIKKRSPFAAKCEIFLCGPPPMMSALRTQFLAMGVKNSRIHSEEFSL